MAARHEQRNARAAAMRAAKQAAAAEVARQEALAARLRQIRHRDPRLVGQLPSIMLKPHVLVADEPLPQDIVGRGGGGDGDSHELVWGGAGGAGYRGGGGCRVCRTVLESISYVFSPWFSTSRIDVRLLKSQHTGAGRYS